MFKFNNKDIRTTSTLNIFHTLVFIVDLREVTVCWFRLVLTMLKQLIINIDIPILSAIILVHLNSASDKKY